MHLIMYDVFLEVLKVFDDCATPRNRQVPYLTMYGTFIFKISGVSDEMMHKVRARSMQSVLICKGPYRTQLTHWQVSMF